MVPGVRALGTGPPSSVFSDLGADPRAAGTNEWVMEKVPSLRQARAWTSEPEGGHQGKVQFLVPPGPRNVSSMNARPSILFTALSPTPRTGLGAL